MSKKIYITESQFNNILIKEMSNEEINKRTKEINHNPTDAQKEASNYKMAHITFSGFKISIENAKGSKRYWKDDKGNTGYNIMKNHYGYFSKSIGHDGDHVDVFLGNNQESDKIYVVDQNKKDGTFDESKVMLGFDSKKEAKEAYLSNFSSDWKGFRTITGVTKKVFKKWLYNDRKQQKPFSEYVEISKKKLNENINKEKPWYIEVTENNENNGYIKLYHNCKTDDLENIILDQELSTKQNHKEGHGNMLWFTIKEDMWERQCKISITVPINKFQGFTNKPEFRFMNNSDVITENNINIYDDNFNFKIEKINSFTFDELKEMYFGNEEENDRFFYLMDEVYDMYNTKYYLLEIFENSTLNESNTLNLDDDFTLTGDYTEEEKKLQAKRQKKSEAAKKAAETRKANKLKKEKELDDKFMQQQKDLGYKGLFGDF